MADDEFLEIKDSDKFKAFKTLISSAKTFLTEAEIRVNEAPSETKSGNFFSTGLAIVDSVTYNPKRIDDMFDIDYKEQEANESNINAKYTFVDKAKNFFDDVQYDVNLGNIDVSKNFNSELNVGLNVDFVGNVSCHVTKNFGDVHFRGAVQYKPTKQEGRVNLNYSDNLNTASSNIYINDYNPGAQASYSMNLGNKESISAGVSVFKQNTNLFVKYKKDKTSLALNGSTQSPYVGVCAYIRF